MRVKQITAKFEMRKLSRTSKPQKILVIRSPEGKILSSIKAVDLRKRGLTKETALRQFKTSKSLNPQIINRTVYKGSKNAKGQSFVQTISKKQFGTKQRSQIGADVFIKSQGKTYKYTGYSDLGNVGEDGQEQSKRRALVGAVNQGIIKYKDIPKIMDEIKARFFYINFNFVSEANERAFARG